MVLPSLEQWCIQFVDVLYFLWKQFLQVWEAAFVTFILLEYMVTLESAVVVSAFLATAWTLVMETVAHGDRVPVHLAARSWAFIPHQHLN